MRKSLYIISGLIILLVGFATFRYALKEQKFSASNPAIIDSAAQSKKSQEPKVVTASFLAAGDIMLSRNVAGTIRKANDILLPYRNLDALLRSTDFNFANLESPFSGKDTFNPTGSLVFNAPRDMVQGLVEYNFKILNFANNHSLDQGRTGLDYTKQFLTQNNILSIGTGQTLDEAWQGQVIDAKGIKIGFIGASYASLNDGGKASNEYVARIEDVARLKSSITNLKTKADYIIVTMHAGTEYVRTPNQGQIDFAHAAIDAGADIIIGAHPHWIQITEQYKDKWIFYSLGNFIFDQEWSQETKEGLVLKITLSENPRIDGARPNLKQIEMIPVILENYCCPRLANEQEKQIILNKIGVTDAVVTP